MKSLKIIKIGGNIINNNNVLKKFIKDFSNLDGLKILVHGGGTAASELSEKLNLEIQKIEGRRITDAATLDVVAMVYAGKINKTIVSQLQAQNCNALGLSGTDANSICSVKRPNIPIDFGFVGDVISVNTDFIELLLKQRIVPVFCAVTHDGKGQLLNTNADTIASELAVSLANFYDTELFYCFEKKGVLHNILDEDSVIKSIDINLYKSLKENGQIAEGMIPKLDNAYKALNQNVKKVCIGLPEMIFKSNSIFTTLKL